MKTKLQLAALALVLSTLNYPLSTIHAQGSLTPPVGTPAPVMKSLDQVEARTPISAAPFSITKSGSYYLTTNLTVATGDAITIATNEVTLDLNGFTIASTAVSATGSGVLLALAPKNTVVKNGFIRSGTTNNGSNVYGGPGFANGIYGYGAVNATVSQVSIRGCANNGIMLGTAADQSLVEACQVKTAGNDGIVASIIKSCTALDCRDRAVLGNTVTDSQGNSTGNNNASGVVANDTAFNCSGTAPSGTGVSANVAINCVCSSTTGTALEANIANSCVAYRFGGTAIQAIVANGCYAFTGTNIITHKYNMP